MGMVIEKTAKILTLVKEHEPCSLKELTELTGMKKPALYLTLKSLVEVEFLSKSSGNQYSLGDGLFRLTSQRQENETAMQLVNEAAREIAAELNESVSVASIEGLEYHRLFMVDSNQTVKVSDVIFGEKKFYRNATGRMLLASADDSLRAKIVDGIGLPDKNDWRGINDIGLLKAELDKIKKDGISRKDTDDGQAVFIAVPVANWTGGMPLAIGVSIPAFRFTGRHKSRVVGVLTGIARQLSENLK